MIHAYMPRGNIDEELYVPKGRRPVAGCAIGILCPGNLWCPLPPGCPQNASTFDFPVLYKIVDETANWALLSTETKEDQFSPLVRNAMIEGAKELERHGVRAISASGGFFADFQKDVAAAVDIPVFLSSLCQIPMIRQGLRPNQKIGVVSAASDFLLPEVFAAVDVKDLSDIVIVGAQDYREFYKVRGTHNVGHYNPFKVEQDLATLAEQLVKDNPDIGAILLECSIMPPYAWAIQNAVNLPVYDIYTLIEWMYQTVVRRPFAGFY